MGRSSPTSLISTVFQVADALPELRGLALYAQAHVTDYRRIESVVEIEIKSKPRVLHLMRDDVRKCIVSTTDVASLLSGA